jgi:mannose-6-phosphate isomerase-like protein (cupin superfamily)
MNQRFSRRSWGWYLTLIDRKHFKVKLLRFNAHNRLSCQYHKMRNELWLFLSGCGYFRRGEEASQVEVGDYRHVGTGIAHQYIPWGKSTVLEIQYGEKCDEGDIVRL